MLGLRRQHEGQSARHAASYKSIPALKDYLLVAQHRPHVSQFVKQADGSWLNLEFNALGNTLNVTSLSCILQLHEIYVDVVFGEAGAGARSPLR